MNTKNETMGSITESVASELNRGSSSMRSIVFVGLALWLGLVYYLASQGVFVGKPGSPPLAIFLGVAIPLMVFFSAFFGWGAFRAFILGADLRLVSAIQAWRWGGLGFLTLYAQGILPGLFALPAGLGDMAVGLSAPWIVLALARNPSFSTSRKYVTWNILGIFDFVIAVTMGTLCSGAFPEITRLIGGATTGAVAQLPLVLIPAYMVPLFTMLHCTALFQARRMARSGESMQNSPN
jgi:hypothetical protein